MWIGVVSIFPEMIRSSLADGVVGRAVSNSLINLSFYDPRDFTTDVHRTVDDRPYGGGPGMVMLIEPLVRAVEKAQEEAPTDSLLRVLLSPQGDHFTQDVANEFKTTDSLLLIAGRYEGVDDRFTANYVDLELSIGDYVLSGGELAAMVVLDAVGRLVEGTVGNPESVKYESLADGLLDYPQFTRPQNFRGHEVPHVLLSGDHAAIDEWRKKEALQKTWERRPDLLLKRRWSPSKTMASDELSHDSDQQQRSDMENSGDEKQQDH